MDISQLTLREKIGQTMMVTDFHGICERFGGMEAFLEAYPIGFIYNGGAIVGNGLFGKDYMEKAASKASEFTKCPVLFGGDLESGMVDGKASKLPSMMNLGATASPELAYKYGRTIGMAAVNSGFKWVFTPVADLNTNPENQIIQTRSIGDDPEMATKLLKELVRGIQDCGVAATFKHFPGLGSENVDSHIAPLELPLSKEEWDGTVRKLYEALFADGLAAVMTAHVSLPAYQTPNEDGSYTVATSSKEITQKLLKDDMNFEGVVVTDALIMGGFSGSSVDLEIESFLAGSDVLLWPSLEYMDVLEQKILSGEISEERLNDAVNRVLALKKKVGLFDDEPKKISVEYDSNISEVVAENSITLLNNKVGLLPLDPNKIKKIFMVAVTPVERYEIRLPIIKKLKDLFEERGIEVVFKTDIFLEELEESKDCDLNLFVIDRPTGIYQGSKDIYGENAASVWASQTSDKSKTIIATFGNPYIYAKYYRHIETYINAYDPHPDVFKAFVKALFGEIEFKGTTPVELKPYYKK